jgi:cyclase
MLKKRLIGVVTVRDGWAVQSFGYKRYLPLGRPEWLVENLNRWGADEILIQVIDRSKIDSGPDFALLERLGKLGLDTPLIYAGGIRSVDDGVHLVRLGADRLVIDALLHDNVEVIKDLSWRLGAQAIIAALPLSMNLNRLEWLDYRSKISAQLDDSTVSLIQAGVCLEVLIVDWVNEGTPASFDQRLISSFPVKNIPVIVFGGISQIEQMTGLLQNPRVTGVAVGNFLSYREHSIQKYKESIAGVFLRHASYQSTFGMAKN